jgi:hypothetical protein
MPSPVLGDLQIRVFRRLENNETPPEARDGHVESESIGMALLYNECVESSSL